MSGMGHMLKNGEGNHLTMAWLLSPGSVMDKHPSPSASLTPSGGF